MTPDVRTLLWPAFAMAALTFAVWVRLFAARIGEMRRLHIDPQSVATSAEAARRFVDTRAADNFRNLFELPVLFYAALGVAIAIHAYDAVTLVLAWSFVALRIAHSTVQCSYNRVMHRFGVYLAGGFVLLILWVWLGRQLL